MAINQNRNSVRVLRTTAVGHLAHKNIPDLSIGTGSDFTIQLWVVNGGDTDGILYSQEGGFSIRLADGQVIFSLDGFATLASGAGWKIAAQKQEYIAVRCQSGTLALFMGGLKVAEQHISAKVSACAGDFSIGKQFTGGFSLIRVSKTARSDREILSDNAVQPAVDSHCVFQSDCSTAQYKDVSANHLSMWDVGEGAGCGIYTACSVFSGQGQVSCAPLEPLSATHTLLLKLWPQDQQRTQRVYTAMDGAKTIYAVELAPQSDHTFLLELVSGNGSRASLSKPILPQLWQDVAVVFDSGRVKLYLDGAAEGTYSFSFSGNRSEVLVGSEYEEGKPYYEKGFCGYMAYTAEFGKALSAKEIALYADDPPFMFEDGLVSLLPLDWPNEVEAVGATALRVTGSAPFALVADITPRGGDIGCSMRIPTEISPYWNELSADEQWTLELMVKLCREELAELCGYSFASTGEGEDIPVYKRIPRQTIRHNGKLYHQLREMSPSPGLYPETTVDVAQGLSGRGSAPLAGGVGGAAAGAGCAAGTASSHAGLIVGMIVGIAVVAAVGAIIAAAEDDRPSDPTGTLRVTGICWNHQGDPTKGGLHYHKGGAKLPASMTDTPGATRLDTLCVLVPSRLNNPTVDVTLSYTSTDTRRKTGTLKAYDLTPGGLLGEQSVAYDVGPNESVTVSLPFKTDKLPADEVRKLTHTWQFRDGNSQLTNCVCILYLLPHEPIAPWTVKSGTDYQTTEPNYARVELLDFFIENGGERKDIPKLCTQALNSCGYFQYHRKGGVAQYSVWRKDISKFLLKLEKLVSHFQAGSHPINCTDCACIVSAGCALAGVSLPMVRIWGDIASSKGFVCNLMVAIGYTGWDKPFEKGNAFSFHQINFNGAVPDEDIPIYDACLKVDGGNYPGSTDTSGKVELLSLGLTLQETSSDIVHVPVTQPYTGRFYRERLAADGEFCQFDNFIYLVGGFSTAVTEPRADHRDTLVNPSFLAVLKRFALDDFPQTADAPLERWDAAPLAGAVVNESAPGYGDWTAQAPDGSPVWVERRFCATAEETATCMAGILFNVASPHIQTGDDGGITLGERCFLLGTGGILFCRRGNVFTVAADSLETALALARKLDDSIQAQL